ncbi:MAG: hypothetical protein ABI838_06900 [Chloroflexota bacterium]
MARSPAAIVVLIVAAVIGVVAVGALGPRAIESWRAAAGHQPATTATDSGGRVKGWVMRAPGSDPRSGGGDNGATIPVGGDSVVARAGGAAIVATAISGPDGSFEMLLPRGVYSFVESICGVSVRAEVTSQATTTVTLTIPNSC